MDTSRTPASISRLSHTAPATQWSLRAARYLPGMLSLYCAFCGQTAVASEFPGLLSQTPNVVMQQSYWFEITLLLLLVGAALFAVCKSGNRR